MPLPNFGMYTPPKTGVQPTRLIPPNPNASGCPLPTNPRLGQTSTDANGTVFTSVDPYWASSATRDAWVAMYPACSAPAYMPDTAAGAQPTYTIRQGTGLNTNPPPGATPPSLPSIPVGVWWGLGAAAVAVVGVTAVAMMRPKRGSRRSSRRSSR